MTILKNTWWRFDDTIYSDAEVFSQAIGDYQKSFIEEGNEHLVWQPDIIMVESPHIIVRYPARIRSEQDLLSNEQATAKDKDILKKKDEVELSMVTINVKLNAENGRYFTALELMYKLHNQQANKPYHFYFEGIEHSEQSIDEIPTLLVNVGT